MDWFLYSRDLHHERVNVLLLAKVHVIPFFLYLEMSAFKEKCMGLKNKLIEFKEKAIDGFRYLDGIVYDVENNNTVDIEGLNTSINSFIRNINERFGKIKEKIDLVKGNLEGTPVADLFQNLEDKFEEYKVAFKPRWEGFI